MSDHEEVRKAWQAGYASGIEDAAKVCDERAVLNDSVEGGELCRDPHLELVATVPQWRSLECQENAAAIRSLARGGRP